MAKNKFDIYKKKKESNSVIIADYDSVAKQWGNPIFVSNLPVLLRDLKTMVNDGGVKNKKKNKLFMYPQDHTIYIIGEWDLSTGKIYSNQKKLINCLDLVVKNEER